MEEGEEKENVEETYEMGHVCTHNIKGCQDNGNNVLILLLYRTIRQGQWLPVIAKPAPQHILFCCTQGSLG